MSLTPRPAEPFQLFLEHYVNAASSPAACDWVGVDEFADSLFSRPALLEGAMLRSIPVPNWAQSFARRDAYYPLYRQVGGMLFKEATALEPAHHLLTFERPPDYVPFKFKWTLGSSDSLQGDVIVSIRSELQIPVRLVSTLAIDMPLAHKEHFAAARLFHHWSDLAFLANLSDDSGA